MAKHDLKLVKQEWLEESVFWPATSSFAGAWRFEFECEHGEKFVMLAPMHEDADGNPAHGDFFTS